MEKGGGTQSDVKGPYGFVSLFKEFLAAGEQEIAHTKPFFFPIASAATYTDSHLEVNQHVYVPD
ncbi:hypothetical protein Taro_050276 [Colocasia esculenta]|uniref:Uncharacterized protein n=1 Tax=Colocasia esculenta TaxID=4460 RepID=A0A843XDF2_COLES|nr:hypothetical protein [Colocasia esculenta]